MFLRLLLKQLPAPTIGPSAIDWLFEPDEDNDEESAFGFNEPTSWEPGDEEDDEEE